MCNAARNVSGERVSGSGRGVVVEVRAPTGILALARNADPLQIWYRVPKSGGDGQRLKEGLSTAA